MKNSVIFLILLLIPSFLLAQTGNIQGKVTYQNQPLPGVNIIIEGTLKGSVSDDDGFYRIENIPEGTYSFKFSMIGFKSAIIKIKIISGKTVLLNCNLETEIINLNEIQIIDIRAQRQEDTRTSLISIKPENAKLLPGAVTDVFRSLGALPGVLSPNDFTSQLVIRGSGPDQNLIVMDDIEVFNPYRLYSVISMFNPEAVSDINLITGGFPVKYGDRLSAVLDVTNRQGDFTKSFKGVIDASIISANVVLEGKNPFNIPGSWLINSRRTYYDLIIGSFVKNAGLVDENVTFPNFFDVQAKIALGPFENHTFFLNGIISRDGVELISAKERKTPDSLGVFNKTKNDLAGFAWHFAPNKKMLNKFVVSWYRNQGDARIDASLLDPSVNRDDFEEFSADTISQYLLGMYASGDFVFEKYSLENKLFLQWGDKNEFEAGIGVDFIHTKVNAELDIDKQVLDNLELYLNINNSIEDLSVSRYYNKYKVWADNKFKISDKLYIQPGIRYDYYELIEKAALSPRLSLSYLLNPSTTLRGSFGLYYQSPGYEKIIDQARAFNLSKNNTTALKPERAVHFIASIEHWLNEQWMLKSEMYYKKFENLLVQKIVKGISYYTEPVPGKDIFSREGWTRPVPFLSDSVTQVPINNSNGYSSGFEIMMEKKKIKSGDRFAGWISYSFAVAERKENGSTYPFRFDQRHTLNIVANYRISEDYDIGLRFKYGSGFPFTHPLNVQPRVILKDSDGDFIPDSPEIATRKTGSSGKETVIYDLNYGKDSQKFNDRIPAYHRLDLRFTAFADYWGLDWQFYLDIINVYNRSNVINYDYYVKDDLSIGKETVNMFPILPTLGFSVRF
ncbi:MAG: TonB-dependent receptor [Ignavibacteria bacterium]|nr:TonB-dependent receptor [Ignavibacteria bacterium]